LGTLCELGSKQRTALLKHATREQVACIAEIALNLLNGNIKISPEAKLKLSRYKTQLRGIVCPKNNLQKRKKLIVQSGGILPWLIKPALTYLVGGLIPALKPFLNNNA